MIRSSARGRSGITLTEILISILIMGVGVVSLATLFPLGLIRLRNAQRLTRGAYLVESAVADLNARNLFFKPKFSSLAVSPWNQTATAGFYDPWLVDTPSYGADWGVPGTPTTAPTYYGAARTTGPGLPVVYDPLWRTVTGVYANPVAGTTNLANRIAEARFGSGIGWLRPEGATLPSAHGLQRLTNYMSYTNYLAAGSPYRNSIALGGTTAITDAAFVQNTNAVFEAFVSSEDIILQDPKGQYPGVVGSPSPVVPDLSTGFSVNDWRFTWFFTGQQSDVNDGSVFDGDIVVCENRPLGIDAVGMPYTGPGYQVSGETVVEAIWGYSSTPGQSLPTPLANFYYGSLSGSRTVILRWPATLPDPDVKVGGWIADVTYERDNAIAAARFLGPYQAQRCFWYQVAKKSEVGIDRFDNTYRSITVWTSTPLRALSLLDFSATPATPAHVEAALIMPSVINVYPRTIYARPIP